MNEYGSREGLMAAIERQAGMKPNAQKTASVINNNTTTAEQKSKVDKKGGAPATSAAPVSNLNKLFSLKSNELKGTSPNKVFIFKYRNKK